MRRYLIAGTVALAAAATWCGLVWLSGFNFDQRGSAAALTAMTCLAIGAISFCGALACQEAA